MKALKTLVRLLAGLIPPFAISTLSAVGPARVNAASANIGASVVRLAAFASDPVFRVVAHGRSDGSLAAETDLEVPTQADGFELQVPTQLTLRSRSGAEWTAGLKVEEFNASGRLKVRVESPVLAQAGACEASVGLVLVYE